MSIITIGQNRHRQLILENGSVVYFEFCKLGQYQGKVFLIDLADRAWEVKKILGSIGKSMFQTGKAINKVMYIEIDESPHTYREVFCNMAREGSFFIGSSPIFKGYTFEHRWCGYECPYFSKETFLEICRQFSYSYEEEIECRCFYDANTDAFYSEVSKNNYARRRIGDPTEINTPYGHMKVYYFEGAWPWEERRVNKKILEECGRGS